MPQLMMNTGTRPHGQSARCLHCQLHVLYTPLPDLYLHALRLPNANPGLHPIPPHNQVRSISTLLVRLYLYPKPLYLQRPNPNLPPYDAFSASLPYHPSPYLSHPHVPLHQDHIPPVTHSAMLLSSLSPGHPRERSIPVLVEHHRTESQYRPGGKIAFALTYVYPPLIPMILSFTTHCAMQRALVSPYRIGPCRRILLPMLQIYIHLTSILSVPPHISCCVDYRGFIPHLHAHIQRILLCVVPDPKYPLKIVRVSRPDSKAMKGNRIPYHILRPVGQIPIHHDPLHGNREGYLPVMRLYGTPIE